MNVNLTNYCQNVNFKCLLKKKTRRCIFDIFELLEKKLMRNFVLIFQALLVSNNNFIVSTSNKNKTK